MRSHPPPVPDRLRRHLRVRAPGRGRDGPTDHRGPAGACLLVLEDPGTDDAERVVGHAYAGPLEERADYRWCCEVGVTVPRDGSRDLHLGFEPVGTFRRIGWKHGQWRAVAGAGRGVGTEDGPPAELC